MLRKSLGTSRFDLLLGASAVATAQNGATNPGFDGLYQGFGGIAYQTNMSLRLFGGGQPFLQLRAGTAYEGGAVQRASPIVELHLGLSSPEAR
jgi:hypothetical protein